MDTQKPDPTGVCKDCTVEGCNSCIDGGICV